MALWVAMQAATQNTSTQLLGAELPFENNLFVYLGLSLDGNKQNHKNAQDHSANKFNKYQVIASIPEEHNLNPVAFWEILAYMYM